MAYYIDSKYARGPARWKRAASNAELRPTSHGAKLYKARRDAAVLIEQNGMLEGARAFYRNTAGLRYNYPDWQRKYFTCSLFCTALQASLDFGSLILMDPEDKTSIDWTELEKYVAGEYESLHVKVVNNDLPERDVRCQVCAASISPHGGVTAPEETPEPTPQPVQEQLPLDGGVTYLVDQHGSVMRPTDVKVVQLTDREQFLFLAAEASTKAAFADLYGAPLA